jgi:ribosomal protein S8
MPDFYVDDLDISPGEFVDACSEREISQLIEVLKDDGYLNDIIVVQDDAKSIHDEMFLEALFKLGKSRHRLTNEEEEIIKVIANRL